MKSETSSTFPAPSEGSPPDSGASQAPRSADGAPTLATLDFALLRGALEEIPFGVATTRGDSILYANEALARIFGVAQGVLENKQVAQLFDEATYAGISQRLDEARVYDGRVRTVGFDGRPIDAEVHIEWYSSEAKGVGGFLVLRDVSLELGALGRLVDQLGAALFRIRVADGAVELVSPAITRLTGIDAATCTQHPVLLTQLISAEERERVVFLYRRMARGEIPVASAQVSLRRADGIVRLLQIRATCRRDTSGVVRHIDGVVSDAAREREAGLEGVGGEGGGRLHGSGFDGALRSAVSAASSAHGAHRFDGGARDPLARAAMELSHELLREGSQHLHTLGRELRGVRAALKVNAGALPADVVEDLLARLDAAAAGVAGSAALNRSVRRVLTAATSLGAPLAEVLENVQATLSAVLGGGEGVLVVDAGDAANVVVAERVEELGAALVYLALRAFRFAGSGTLRISARRLEPTRPPPPRRPATPGPAAPPGSSGRARTPRQPAERRYVTIEIVGIAPSDLTDGAVEISSDMLRTVPRPAEADVAHQAAHTLIAAVGGSIETDDTTFTTARSVVRLRV